MEKNSKILILGSNGLVGSAIKRELLKEDYISVLAPTRKELNLLNQKETNDYFQKHKPNYVFMAAAKVGGIQANNTYRADFIVENLMIQTNVFQAAFESDVEKFLFLGSSCIYPKKCPQPIKEEYLLTSQLEETNEPYAIAKIAGLKMAENYRRQYRRQFLSVMPSNLYGINDNFHKENSHVIPGLIARMSEAIQKKKEVFEIWGTGTPKREFLYIDDLSQACIFLMKADMELPYYINIGSGKEISIKDLAILIAKLMEFKGKIIENRSYPDGTMRKLLDISKIKSLGWSPKTSLEEGLKKTIDFYRSSKSIRKY